MALPEAALITGTELANWLELTPPIPGEEEEPPVDPEQLEELAAAVDELIRGFSSTIKTCDGLEDWPHSRKRGAKMLAARLHRRRTSPEGVYTLGAGDAIAYVNRNDPDVATLLKLNMPAVG